MKTFPIVRTFLADLFGIFKGTKLSLDSMATFPLNTRTTQPAVKLEKAGKTLRVQCHCRNVIDEMVWMSIKSALESRCAQRFVTA